MKEGDGQSEKDWDRDALCRELEGEVAWRSRDRPRDSQQRHVTQGAWFRAWGTLRPLRLPSVCLAEYFLLDEVADAPVGFVSDFALRDGMIDSMGHRVVMAHQTHDVVAPVVPFLFGPPFLRAA